MDVSLQYLVDGSQIGAVSLTKQNGDRLYSSNREGARRGTESEPEESFLSYLVSNMASKAVFDLLANGVERGSAEEKRLISHSMGKPLYRLNQIFPLTLRFLAATGIAGGPRIQYSTSVWFDKSVTIKEDFKNVLESYRTQTYKQDFTTEDIRSNMNEWIRIHTGGLISDALKNSDIRADTRLMIAATLDFDGKWSVPFQDAGEKDFTLINGQVIKMPYMTSRAPQYVQQFQNFKLLNIPFNQHRESRFSMLFYLPDDVEHTINLRDFIGLHEHSVMDVYFPENQVEVGEFLIPKFKLNASSFFDLGRIVDLEEVSDSPRLFTTYGRVRGYLDINETGARAAATTAFSSDIMTTVPPSPAGKAVPAPSIEKIKFVVNRPFIFFIRDLRFRRMLFSGGLFDTDNARNLQ